MTVVLTILILSFVASATLLIFRDIRIGGTGIQFVLVWAMFLVVLLADIVLALAIFFVSTRL
jgi:hypothetical protein